MSLVNVKPSVILDIYDHNLTPSSIKTIALDSKTRFVAAVIRNRGEIYDIGQDAAVALTVVRPDKTRVQITGQTYSLTETTRDDETITYYGASAELTQLALAIKGNLRAQFKITSGEQELRTEIFTINNGEALDAGDDPWAGDLDGHNLDEMAQNIEDLSSDVSEIQEDVTELKSGFNDLYNAAFVTDSASGSIAHITDGADSIPMKSLKVNIAPVQSGSGDPSPENVRPISGWDAVKVYHSGENTEEATEYNISLTSAGTVYGGTLDVVSGELTVSFRSLILSSNGIGNYSFNSTNGQLRITSLLSMPNILENICSHYKTFSGSFANLPDKSFLASSSTIAINDTNYTSLESWKSYLDAQLSANTPVQVCVKLSEPQTIQLTQQEIKSLLGINNVWSDAGDVDVKYRADTKLYIDKRLAEVTA